MNFLQLLHGAEVLAQSGNPNVNGLEYDSRRVKPGDAFVAMRGEASDGNKFIDKAIAQVARRDLEDIKFAQSQVRHFARKSTTRLGGFGFYPAFARPAKTR